MISLSVVFQIQAKPTGSFETELISVNSDEQEGQAASFYASEIRAGSVSADGRYVVFSSTADNFTTEDVSGWHIYLRDRDAGTTTRITNTTTYGSSTEGKAVISANGQFIAFESTSGQLVANDSNGCSDIFVYNRADSSLTRVSVASDGSQSTGCSCGWPNTCNNCEADWVNSHPSISADGRYIAFTSYAYNFVNGDVPDTPDVFIHDQQTGTTTIISQASDGNLGNADSGEPSISADGDFVAFSSKASNLVTNDTNNQQDVFLWRRDNGNLVRISIATDGTEGNSTSTDPVISGDGNLIAFTSWATSLVTPDTNDFTNDIFVRNVSQGTTTRLSAGLPSGGKWPAISSTGEFVSFTTGTSEVYLSDLGSGQRQLIDDDMQFSALNFDGSALVMSGYASLVPSDTDYDKDVYLIKLDVQAPPVDPEICDDSIDNDGDGLIDCDDWADCNQQPACAEQEPPVDDPGDTQPGTSTDDTSNSDDSGGSCAYRPGGRFDPILPALVIAGLVYLGWRIKRKRSR